ncbi:MAG: TetR/AcrR family transcriptional regulator [Chloroflexi bacterium]|nr:TetR/AcrR family transcriptional regulator [Chloroflexota bacterium]
MIGQHFRQTIRLVNRVDDDLIFRDPRPSRADAVKNRDRLLRTAQRLFGEQGVDTVSMSAVAEAAGVGKGTLYRHFASKGDLCRALLDEDQRHMQTETFERLRTHPDPYANLVWFLGEVLAFAERNAALLLVEVGGGEGIALDHPAHFWWRQTIRGLLNRIDAPDCIDRDYAADVLYLMLDARTLHFQRQVQGYSRERVHTGLITTLARLLG